MRVALALVLPGVLAQEGGRSMFATSAGRPVASLAPTAPHVHMLSALALPLRQAAQPTRSVPAGRPAEGLRWACAAAAFAGLAAMRFPARTATTAAARPRAPVVRALVGPAGESPVAVITDMDETLISRKSTGYVIRFLVKYRAIGRLLLLPICFATLIPLSKVSRSLAVRILYWVAFRGVRVDKAKKIAAEDLSVKYAQDLQDPAASAVLDADNAVVITASPTFMARPWLERYVGVPAENVYGAELTEKDGRFTGFLDGDIPIGQTKVDLLNRSVAAKASWRVGFGDHPTDVPFLEACDRGVLVHELKAEEAGSCEYEPARPFDLSKISI